MNKLKVLGCGDAFASGGRHTTSFLIEINEKGYLLDCGASTLVRLKQEKYDISKITAIIITHFHGDHYGGLPFLLITNKFEFNGKLQWKIIGPEGIKKQLFALQEAMYPGTGILLDELNIEFFEFGDHVLAMDNLEIMPVKVTHSPLAHPHGVRITWNSKSLAFSGDTQWDENLTTLAKDTTLFITECNTIGGDTPGHLGFETILANQDRLGAKKIVLSHMGEKMLSFSQDNFEKLTDGQEIELW